MTRSSRLQSGNAERSLSRQDSGAIVLSRRTRAALLTLVVALGCGDANSNDADDGSPSAIPVVSYARIPRTMQKQLADACQSFISQQRAIIDIHIHLNPRYKNPARHAQDVVQLMQEATEAGVARVVVVAQHFEKGGERDVRIFDQIKIDLARICGDRMKIMVGGFNSDRRGSVEYVRTLLALPQVAGIMIDFDHVNRDIEHNPRSPWLREILEILNRHGKALHFQAATQETMDPICESMVEFPNVNFVNSNGLRGEPGRPALCSNGPRSNLKHIVDGQILASVNRQLLPEEIDPHDFALGSDKTLGFPLTPPLPPRLLDFAKQARAELEQMGAELAEAIANKNAERIFWQPQPE